MGRSFSLDDKYTLDTGTLYMTGIQALVRLPLEQMRRDRLAGLNTATWISGYEGSPLGGYDLALQRVQGLLSDHHVHFMPGVNEDLAAATVMGSQIYQALPEPLIDGVVGIWYGKGPGVDRTGDVFRHANLAGTGRHCGALALAGDDHMSKSSTIPHQSEISFYNYALPILVPGNTQEILDYGLLGIAMSRYSGAWTALKLVTDICDGGGTLEVSPQRCRTQEPELLIDGELYRKRMDPLLIVPISLSLEKELHQRRLLAAREFARVNRFNEITVRHANDRLGIVAAGKSYYDLMSALTSLGLGANELEQAGVRILKLAMVYPLEPSIIEEFIAGLDEVLVIEEKRSFIELQLREMLYNHASRPAIYGKQDSQDRPLFPSHGELDAEIIAQALARRMPKLAAVERRLAQLARIEVRLAESEPVASRGPMYCSGCPHNRSTLLLDGQIAGGGIGCHGMAAGMDADRGIAYIGHMGGEGAAWIGAAPFSGKKHIFQNIGDGTYFHSGRMAIHAAVAAGVNITFKLLYNGTVAMTGGQVVAGGLPIPELTNELASAGVKRIVLLSDDTGRYRDRTKLAAMTEVHPREDLETLLAELENTAGVSMMIYDQMCAAQKRRQRNRGQMAQPLRRIMINERVCEGCGHCVAVSNCVSLHPVDTEYGPKTRVHQSSCNADYTCVMGDCPSFVSVMIEEGSELKKKAPPALPAIEVAEPAEKVGAGQPYHVLMPGVGGTGVVTVNALLATAAVLEGKYVATLDQTGLAQKGGAVVSHLTLSNEPIRAANRISFGSASLLLGFDVLGAASAANRRRLDPELTVAVVNSRQTPTGDSVRKGLTVLSADDSLNSAIHSCTRADRNIFVDASTLAESLFGSHLQANIFLLGVAYQAGLIPLAAESVEEAIRLNGVQVARNLDAFRWGRRYQVSPGELQAMVSGEQTKQEPPDLDSLIAGRVRELTAFQNAEYAGRYRRFAGRFRDRAAELGPTQLGPAAADLAEAVAMNLYKLMAYKDEYEVARLLTLPEFESQARNSFEAPLKMVYHLHPPLLRSLGMKSKLSLGPWFRPVLRMLAWMKSLRGTRFDVFGWAEIRREERALIGWYEQTLGELLSGLDRDNAALITEIARVPEQIRGYEQIKLSSIEQARQRVAELLAQLARPVAA